ncbi:unnamed protein product [Effrenium voratum]|uniref:PARP catalytic domain-containing protein n=1 Tax=Effrenium voratum TaxID=2562239 RepID=A0AA36HS33_9DINO|nr:unnamed protein product [Effrenium voratum]
MPGRRCRCLRGIQGQGDCSRCNVEGPRRAPRPRIGASAGGPFGLRRQQAATRTAKGRGWPLRCRKPQSQGEPPSPAQVHRRAVPIALAWSCLGSFQGTWGQSAGGHIAATLAAEKGWSAAPSPWASDCERCDEAAAASVLQAYWRGAMVRAAHRRRLWAAQRLVELLRALLRAREDRRRFLRLKGAALRIQHFLREQSRAKAPMEAMGENVPMEPMSPRKATALLKMATRVMGRLPKLEEPGGVRPALRGAARRKLLGEESPRLCGERVERPRRRSCGSPVPERKVAPVCPSPPRREAPRLDSGALILSELLSQGLLVQEETIDDGGPLQAALRELTTRTGSQICLVARVAQTSALAAAYSAVRASLGPERLMWHGTSWDCVPNIVRSGFNRAYAFNARHGSKLGRGVYFAEDPGYALRFAGRGATRCMLLSGVLPGNSARGKEGLLEPPRVDATGARFDSTCDDPGRPRVFCVFKDFQALPLYLVQVSVP